MLIVSCLYFRLVVFYYRQREHRNKEGWWCVHPFSLSCASSCWFFWSLKPYYFDPQACNSQIMHSYYTTFLRDLYTTKLMAFPCQSEILEHIGLILLISVFSRGRGRNLGSWTIEIWWTVLFCIGIDLALETCHWFHFFFTNFYRSWFLAVHLTWKIILFTFLYDDNDWCLYLYFCISVQ